MLPTEAKSAAQICDFFKEIADLKPLRLKAIRSYSDFDLLKPHVSPLPCAEALTLLNIGMRNSAHSSNLPPTQCCEFIHQNRLLWGTVTLGIGSHTNSFALNAKVQRQPRKFTHCNLGSDRQQDQRIQQNSQQA